MRKPDGPAIVVLLALTVLGGLLPILQGWIFFVLALYVLRHRVRDRPRSGSSAPAGAGPLCRAGSPPPAIIAGRRAICASSTI